MTSATKGAAGVTEEAKAAWWLRFNNGVPVCDEQEEERLREGAGSADPGGKAAAAGSVRRATYAAAGYEEAEMEMEMGPSDGTVEGVKAEMVVARGSGGGKAKTEAAGAGGKRRSSPRFADRAALDEEISGGNCLHPAGELPQRKMKAIAKRTKLKFDAVEFQNDISQGMKNISQAQSQSPHPALKGPERVYEENENLKLQLALKTTELKEEENRRLQLELILKSKENESLQKQIEELKAENEQLRKNVKPPRVRRLCRFCNAHVMHDYRNCPERLRAASSSSPEEQDGEDS